MKQDFYILANKINSSDEHNARMHEIPDSVTQMRYKKHVLDAIHREKRRAKRKHLTAAAACLFIIASVTGIFHNEVQAAIEQIHYSLGEAFGLGNTLSRYTEVINTSVHNGDYVITLQEAIAAPEKLYISYIIQREDGQSMSDENFFSARTELFINGKPVSGGSSLSSGYLDEEKKICSSVAEYHLYDCNLSGENIYELKLTDYRQPDPGTWTFKFKADGSEIYADTKSMELGCDYTLPDGTVITLDELRLNKLEQKITFHLSNNTCIQYDSFELYTVDEHGKTAKFTACSCENNKGYMINSYVPNGEAPLRTWIADDANKLTVTAYIVDLPEIDGLDPDDYKYQTGEVIEWNLEKLKELEM